MSRDKLLIAICDDDPLMLERVREVCARTLKDIDAEILATGDSRELMERGSDIRIAVLDIQMPGEDGISLASILQRKSRACQIIFCSGFVDYVSDVYDVPHLSLVMKDRLEERLPGFLLRAVDNLRAEESAALTIHGRAGITRVLPAELSYLERRGHTTYVKLRGGGEYTTSAKLDDILASADVRFFCRCHVSYAVYLGSVRSWNRTSFEMEDGTQIPISRAKLIPARESFFAFIAQSR